MLRRNKRPCPHCGENIPATWHRCPQCGTSVSELTPHHAPASKKGGQDATAFSGGGSAFLRAIVGVLLLFVVAPVLLFADFTGGPGTGGVQVLRWLMFGLLVWVVAAAFGKK